MITSESLGRAGYYGFALFMLLSTSTAYLCMAIMLLMMIWQLPDKWPMLRRDPLFRIAALFAVYLLGRVMVEVLISTGSAMDQAHDAWDWFSIWLLIVVSWWAPEKNAQQKRMRVLGLVLLGFIIRIAYEGLSSYSITELTAILAGTRTGLNYSITSMGVYTTVAFWGFVVFAPRLLGRQCSGSIRHAAVALALVLTGALMITLLVLTQSRVAWLGFLLAMAVVGPAAAFRLQAGGRGKRMIAAIVIGIVIICTAAYHFNEVKIKTRLGQEKQTIREIMSRNWIDVPYTAIGVRVHLFFIGIDKFVQKPFFGWGAGTDVVPMTIAKTDHRAMKRESHLHNTYLSLLVRLGATGAVFYMFGVYCLAYGVIRSCRHRWLEPDECLFYAVFALIVLLACASSYRVQDVDFRFFWITLAGLAYAPYFHRPAADPAGRISALKP